MPPRDPISILLVEDEGLIARDLEDTLTRLGYRVTGIASEGAEAIEMARELHPQLVVMDVSLRGDVDGIEAACAIQEDAPVPVIFLTGHSDTETLQRAVSTGPLGYLIKPFQEDDLRCAIEVAIHKHRSDIERREREEHLRRSAENLSLIDELTQLKNRRGFFELAEQALKIAQREQHTHGAVLHGPERPEADQRHARPHDRRRGAARHGRGSAHYVPRLRHCRAPRRRRVRGARHTCTASSMSKRCARGCASTCGSSTRRGTRSYEVDLSIGATLVDEPADQDLEEFIARADEAMYREKRAIARDS